MAEYELVREIQNSCSGNQMRDVFFRMNDENLTIFASSHGLRQKFLFTLI